MEEDILREIGSVKCEKCGGTCLLDIYSQYFRCQNCCNKYIFEEKE